MITDRTDLRNMAASIYVCYGQKHLTPTMERTIIGLWMPSARVCADASR
jgi:hypothetical protein